MLGSILSVFSRSVLVFACVMLSACDSSQDAPREVNWADEEILSQLAELREEVATLRGELAAVSEKLDGLEKPGSAVAPAGPSMIPLPAEPHLGSAKAEFAIIEYSDFQCPFCARHFREVLPDLQKHYIDTGKVRYWLQDFPLSFHPQAAQAAVAVRCAGQQGGYWPMHDALFQNASALVPELYTKFAGDLGLDLKKFSTCMSDTSMLAKVHEISAQGERYGVSGTPKFFIGRIKNNKMVDVSVINGAQGFAVFQARLDALMTAK